MREMIDRWLETLKEDYSKSTIQSYSSLVRMFIEYVDEHHMQVINIESIRGSLSFLKTSKDCANGTMLMPWPDKHILP